MHIVKGLTITTPPSGRQRSMVFSLSQHQAPLGSTEPLPTTRRVTRLLHQTINNHKPTDTPGGAYRRPLALPSSTKHHNNMASRNSRYKRKYQTRKKTIPPTPGKPLQPRNTPPILLTAPLCAPQATSLLYVLQSRACNVSRHGRPPCTHSIPSTAVLIPC